MDGLGTLTGRFLSVVEAHGDRVALRERGLEPGTWLTWTYAEVAACVAGAVQHLTDLGLQPGDRIAFLLRNSPRFYFLDLAALFCGATPLSIYNSSSPEQVQGQLEHSGARIVVVEDDGLEERVRSGGTEPDRCVHLGRVDEGDFFSGGPALAGGKATATDLATVIYTSGTTGPPKGVMLTHANVVSAIDAYLAAMAVETVGMRSVSYLPHAHVAERLSTYYLAIGGAFEVTTCPDPADVLSYVADVHPHRFFGVPRIWEKARTRLVADLPDDERAAFVAALAEARALADERTGDPAGPAAVDRWRELDAEHFAPARRRAGLDELAFAVTGAAPVDPELVRWYRAMGVPMTELYGLSETSGPLTWTPHESRVGTVGQALPGCSVTIATDGEVLCRGGNVFVGYLDDAERTAEVLSDDGELRTGDLGALDADGFLRIVGRKKELLITSGGKNLSPVNLEAALTRIDVVGQACVVGDRRPYPAALLVLEAAAVRAWAATEGVEGAAFDDVRLLDHITREVEGAMASFSQAERVKRFLLLADEWLPSSDELTPTSKLRRHVIVEKYAEEIEHMYAG